MIHTEPNDNFWLTLPNPSFSLAPMEDVTDTVFRELILHISGPGTLHVVFSEFTSTDGLCHEKGKEKVKHRLFISEEEKALLTSQGVKIVGQLWGSDPENFHHAARMVDELSAYDGIDINMGCPVRKIINQGACSALIRNPSLAGEIIHAVKDATRIPVCVKTRLGFHSLETESWIGSLLEHDLAAIIIHGRTQSAESTGPVHWEEIAKAVSLRNRAGKATAIIGNGDVLSLQEGERRAKETGTDGIMIGRGVFHNPWIFNREQREHSVSEKIALLDTHTRRYTQVWDREKNFEILKRFFKIYASGFHGASHLRMQLMKTSSYEEVADVISSFISSPASE
jgi:nifR3 family TIM-barrel protein